MSLLRSASVVGFFTLLSRILGFVRDVLTAAVLGAGWVNDAFVVAQRFPNLFRSLFAEGAFSAAFVPLFSKAHAVEGPEAARRFAMTAQVLLASVLLVFSIAVVIWMPLLMGGVAAGFQGDATKFAFTIELARITFPYLLFMGLCALYAGVLTAMGRFAAPAAAPILLNIMLIGALVAAHIANVDQATTGRFLAWALVVSGGLQLLWMIAAAKRAKILLPFRFYGITPRVKQFFALTVPGAMSAGVTQINVLVGTIIATHQASAASYLYYADRLYQLPLGVVGIAVGMVLLPALSQRFAHNDDVGARMALNRAVEFAMFMTLPCAVALYVVPLEIIVPLFERGAFDRTASYETARALSFFAMGLPAYVLIKVLTPAYFAREDTKTPLIYASCSVATNIIGSLILFPLIGHVGIAMATALAAWVNVSLLIWTLKRRGDFGLDADSKVRLVRMALSCVGLMAMALLVSSMLAKHFDAGGLPSVISIAVLVVLSGGVYLVLTISLKAITPQQILGALRRRG